jgi:hypothetical protein
VLSEEGLVEGCRKGGEGEGRSEVERYIAEEHGGSLTLSGVRKVGS